MELKDIYKIYTQNYKVTTDTRNISQGDIFFALKGENFNGNKFTEEAIQKGAILCIIDEKKYHNGKNIIYVENVLDILQSLAKYHRQQLKIPFIGITGSNGKTTTKELLKVVLDKKYNTIATFGNLNNHIGVPLTLLSITPKYEMAIVEMGANHQQEIAFLCDIAQPDYGYITNFGKAHLDGFGGFEGVIKGKSELYEYIAKSGKKAFVNVNDELQLKQSKYFGVHRIEFKTNENSAIKLNQSFPFVNINIDGVEIRSHLTGEFNFYNMAITIKMGQYFNISSQKIKEAIESYIPKNNRCQIIEKNTSRIVLDAYNANPTSVKQSIENFYKFENDKIIILGDMYELGNSSEQEHQNIVNILEELNFEMIYLVGSLFYEITTNKKSIQKFKTFEEFKGCIDFKSLKNKDILIKGSRGMALERVLDLL